MVRWRDRKNTIRWTRDGRRTHVFNLVIPLSLGFFDRPHSDRIDEITGKGDAITQFSRPICIWCCSVGLRKYFFGVTSMTMAAVVTTYVRASCTSRHERTSFRQHSDRRVLGMHLRLPILDSPRTDLGRMIFGVMYGASTMVLYAVLAACVPTFTTSVDRCGLNLSVKAIDGWREPIAQRSTRALGPLTPSAGTWRTSCCGRCVSRS